MERQRFLETLRRDEEFRAAVRRELELEQLGELPGQIVHLTSAVNGLVDHQAELGRTVAALAENQVQVQRDVAELTRIVGQTLRATTEGLGSVVERIGTLEDGFDRLEGKLDRGFTTISAHLDQLDSAIEELRNRRSA